MKYIQPKVFENSFTCPNCGVLAKQNWCCATGNLVNYGISHSKHFLIRTGCCQHCEKYTVWVLDKMVFPIMGNTPFPNAEMPEEVKKLYLEAGSISSQSPRGAAALLRLAIQILCKELGETGKNINADISNLVSKGLPEIVQQSLDVVRVVGNDAVHPGQIDTDDIEVVGKLFELVNIIVEYMIALPKKVSGIYTTLPKDKLEGIDKKDKK
ncbi:DUF4145 domain-containing protein [Bergeyella zoohelcum]|uniref:DUF4145 domain-containing protein n=1 Tax=Bergeyella zoohelcum TaxID=1015 RepID=A0A7Z8YRL3_9FLAO|nr:DUF4145 domain-containing protein [Bergeyella zoohelcum]VDH04623.1 Uncharacterised protein [Bergeyella zoohelcum]